MSDAPPRKHRRHDIVAPTGGRTRSNSERDPKGGLEKSQLPGDMGTWILSRKGRVNERALVTFLKA